MRPDTTTPRHVLPVIILSQFAGGSTWFAGNAVFRHIEQHLSASGHALSHVTSAVQAGFIAGTLIVSFFNLSDRFSPRLIFLVSALLNGAVNFALTIVPVDSLTVLGSRFCTGLFLAGIYPIGMQIAAGWYKGGLGRALGYLVGALVLGTAFPHLIESAGRTLSWAAVMTTVSLLSVSGGVLLFALVPLGPYAAPPTRFDIRAFRLIFGSPGLRAAAFGYFGHMWELYAMWAFVPVFLAARGGLDSPTAVSAWSFAVIAIGSLGCIVGGIVSQQRGSARVARAQLIVSGGACLSAPLLFRLPPEWFLLAMLIWGIAVVGDSPQFSALSAREAPRHLVGSALAIVTCIGFAITIVTIQLLGILRNQVPVEWLPVVLGLGPILGVAALRPLARCESMKGSSAPADERS